MLLALLALSQDWSTAYERSGYVGTGDYAEAMAYCRRLEKASPYAKTIVYGRSPEGRDMVALLVSRDRSFSPEAMTKSAKPLVFVQNGIHSGEIEGKDASLILAREMLIEGKYPGLLQGANYVIVPIYSVDAHERRSPYNRINQNGPAEMGFRATSQNYNLNRDYMKADAPESQAQIRLLHRYRPDFFFDNHTTDGADYPYSAMLSVPSDPTLPPATAAWQRTLYDRVKALCDRDGFLTAPYFGLRDPGDPSKGISVEQFSPRYSHGYLGAMNRPTMLVETHMLKPYRHRVEATHSVMVHTIEQVVRDAAQVKAMNAAADAAEREGHPVDILDVKLSPESRPFTFNGWKFTPFRSEVTGSLVPKWEHTRVDVPSKVWDTYEPSLTVQPPAAYAVPPQWTEVIDKLRLHGLRIERLQHPMGGEFEGYRLESVTFARQPFEGRTQPSYRVTPIHEARALPTDTAIVRTDQVGAKLLMALLEPAAPDSLARWGLFNLIFERKEYFEDYAMEPIAADMLRRDAKLKAEFDAKLSDPKFVGRERLAWLFERSPYSDTVLNRYPIVRISKEQLAQMDLRKDK